MELIEACRQIVEQHQAGLVRVEPEARQPQGPRAPVHFAFKFTSDRGHKRGWTIVDAFSASAYLKVYAALSSENKRMLSALGLRGFPVVLRLLK